MAGGKKLTKSQKPWDWLGPGTYFWESDPVRALRWATDQKYKEPCVVGAVIDLGSCLDLSTQLDHHLVEMAYDSLKGIHQIAGKPMPVNKKSNRGGDADRKLRYLDCAVITHVHEFLELKMPDLQKYDTVRGMFVEGEELYEGSAFRRENHIQIAVLNENCIKGVFFA